MSHVGCSAHLARSYSLCLTQAGMNLSSSRSDSSSRSAATRTAAANCARRRAFKPVRRAFRFINPCGAATNPDAALTPLLRSLAPRLERLSSSRDAGSSPSSVMRLDGSCADVTA